MAYDDVREFLGALETRGRLRRITREVDPAWEPACLARWMYQALPEEQRFGLLFERVAGYDMPLMAAVLGASRQNYALALEVSPDEIGARWAQALMNPVSPASAAQGLCQEVVLTGAEADLHRLPVPIWTPGKDVAPYITNATITRDADTGHQNTATYRTMLLDQQRVAVNLSPGRHGTRCASTYWRRGQAAPIAWVLGAEPVVNLAAVANVPYGVDEVTIAGGLKGEPVEVVPAKTIELMVPARAELIIEAELRPGESANEGPFGEFAGYMGPVNAKPIATITAITHRANPIYHGLISQMPPSESTTVQSIGNAGLLYKLLRHDLGHGTVQDVHIDLTFGGLLAHGIVSMTPLYPGHAKQVGRLVADLSFLKRVTVVDADVDIRDPMHMDWALNSRFNPARDTVIIDDVFTPANMDPTVPAVDGKPGQGSKLVIDATEREGVPPLSLPDKELMLRALDSWRESALPEFEIPKRVALMLGLER